MKAFVKSAATLLAAVILMSCIVLSASGIQSGNIVSAPVPHSADEAELLWSRRFGSSYRDAPSTMAVVGDTLIVMCRNTLYKLSAASGKIEARAEMADSICFGYTPPLYAVGIIFCPLDNGTIQAFDFDTLRSLWIYSDELGGQSLSPIVYSDGCIYTGFWNDEDADADFVCIEVSDEDPARTDESKRAVWTYTNRGGYYWAGCALTDSSVLVGTDDGTFYSDRPSRVLSLEKSTGRLLDSVSVSGDVRSGITVAGNTAYFVTKAGFLYSVKVEEGYFDSGSLKKLSLGGASTSTPAIYNGRLYIGVQGGTIKDGSIKIIDAESLTEIYSAPANGYPQSSALICDAYFPDTNCVYIYTTYNAPPGGITVYTDRAGQTLAERSELFVPEAEKANYSVSTITADAYGTLFYKNDSGYIFAVGRNMPPAFEKLKRLFTAVTELMKEQFAG